MPKHATVASASTLYLALTLVNFSAFGEFFRTFLAKSPKFFFSGTRHAGD
jgi:hypothetical protein